MSVSTLDFLPHDRGTTRAATVSTSVFFYRGREPPAKELILKQDASLLLEVQKQIKETTKVLVKVCAERMKKDVEILASNKGIGVKTAL